jgi:hypothetical protein
MTIEDEQMGPHHGNWGHLENNSPVARRRWDNGCAAALVGYRVALGGFFSFPNFCIAARMTNWRARSGSPGGVPALDVPGPGCLACGERVPRRALAGMKLSLYGLCWAKCRVTNISPRLTALSFGRIRNAQTVEHWGLKLSNIICFFSGEHLTADDFSEPPTIENTHELIDETARIDVVVPMALAGIILSTMKEYYAANSPAKDATTISRSDGHRTDTAKSDQVAVPRNCS